VTGLEVGKEKMEQKFTIKVFSITEDKYLASSHCDLSFEEASANAFGALTALCVSLQDKFFTVAVIPEGYEIHKES
jgi:hypothetical protein